MSKDEVRATEPTKPAYESENALGYRGELVESECMIYYEFDEKGLARAAYMIDHSDDGHDILDYNKVKTLLTRKYGDPKEDEMDLTTGVYRLPQIKQTLALGTAIAEGAVSLKTCWETADTYIGLACRGVKGNAQVAVMYNCLDARNRASESSAERDLEKL